MDIMISSTNEKLANKMGVLMLQVYNDAKKELFQHTVGQAELWQYK